MVLTVEVRDLRIRKPYLGSWRHRVTGVIYANAASQTGPLAKSNVENFCSSGTQYIYVRDAAVQSNKHVATQMYRYNIFPLTIIIIIN